ncbi:hypothetical protein [Leptolyngbya sp. O-77]|uniref:hypothetical protein n=1 Tax=Leptolyngbya sp. O-77 TaxID=1080068 RepID=UPI00074D3900|nr:hypothetical protein [Leptolyngbya sp. O-77]BAU44259.1 hypothetical protein O77CONTIG1_04098 [Leptolyngbya sp. O-77]
MFRESQPLPASISADAPDVALPPQDKAQRGRFAKRSLRESPAAPAQSDAALDPQTHQLEHQQHIHTRELMNRSRASHYQQRRLF